MTQYLITNARTLAETWIDDQTATLALTRYETERRSVAGEAPLPRTARVSHYSGGAVIDLALGDSFIRGRRENVVREG